MTDLPTPLIATSDEQLLDDALRWCAAAGAIPELAHDVVSARRGWRRAACVLVGEDLAEALSRADLGRRDHVMVVARDPSAWWAVAVGLGAGAVHGLHEEQQILESISAALDGHEEACLVSVVGGCGGAGASTFAVTLGLAAHRRGLKSLVLDADPLGGGIDLVLGAERADGLRWHDLGAAQGHLSAGSLADVLPTHRGVSMLSWGQAGRLGLPDPVSSVLTAAVRGFDLVVADVPRHLGTQGAEVVGRSVLTILMVPEEITAVAAARQVAARIRECAPTLGVVSVRRAGGIGPTAVGDALDLPVVARHGKDRSIRSSVDRGHGPGGSRSARRTADRVLDALGMDAS